MSEHQTVARVGTHAEDAFLVIEMLGGFRVHTGARTVPDSVWRLSKARSLLKLLALAPGFRLTREQVLDLLWPDMEPETAANNLHQTLHIVRRAIRTPERSGEVRLQHGVLSLQPDGDIWVDVAAFEAAANKARRSDDPTFYHTAIALYAGPLLPDDLYEDWAATRREALHETQLRLLLEVARRHEARGELRQAMEALRSAVGHEPTCEEAHMELVRLYASTGQRGRAIRQYAQLQDALASELDAEPDESSQKLYDAILAGRGQTAPSQHRAAGAEAMEHEPEGSKHNLPIALTSFVGRQQEIEEIKSALAASRLLTLTGVGGAGKTRLAMRVGWDLLSSYRDGVWLVRLASLADGDLVPGVVAHTLQIAEQPGRNWTEALVGHLRSRQALLILDNCEHLREACARLGAGLLSHCAELQILSTSQARLGVPGEITMLVKPLSVPQTEEAVPEDLMHCEAIQLFVERARFRQPAFALTARSAPGITRICRQVEGIPLAVELAASRIATLSVDQIADYLGNTLGFLASGDAGEDVRHQTLRAALDWSYGLLDDDERRLFRWLSVFDGGWSLESAEALETEKDQLHALELLSRLVDKSLVVVEGSSDETVRYRMLEPVRQYAGERLSQASEDAAVHRRHAGLQVAFAERAESELRREDARFWLEQLDTEHDNLRAALRWSLDAGDLENGLRIAGAIWRFWFMQGHLVEGRAVLGSLIEAGGTDESIPPAVRARAFNAAGALAFYQTDTEEASQRFQLCLELRRRIGDEQGIAMTLSNLGLVRKDRGEYESASALFEESLSLCTRLGNVRGMASALGNMGIMAQEQGDYEQASTLHVRGLALARADGGRGGILTSLNNLGALAIEQSEFGRAQELLTEALQLAMEIGNKRSWFVAATNLGHVARKQGKFEEALRRYREGLTLAREQGEKGAVATCLEGLAAGLAATGDTVPAVTLFSAADSLRQSTGTPATPVEQKQHEEILARARQRLKAGFDAAWEAGQSAGIDDIVERALHGQKMVAQK